MSYQYIIDEWNALKLDVYVNGLVQADQTWNYPDVRDSFNRLYIPIGGDARLKDDHETHEMRAGRMYLIPADARCSYLCESTLSMYCLHFNVQLFPGTDLFAPFGRVRELPCPGTRPDAILKAVADESLEGLLHLKTLLWQIVYEFFRDGADSTGYLDMVKGLRKQKAVLDYLSEHLNAATRMEDIAGALGMPVYQLSRTFRRDTGYGLKAYMERMLMQRARHRLMYTDAPVSGIAEELGFADAFYFSRFFKKMDKITPRDFRNRRF